MRKLAMIAVVLSFGVLVAACGGGDGGGACIVPSPVRTPAWDACHNGWAVSECTSAGGQASSSSCSDLGFTTTCSADGSNTYRRSGYSC
jgi:hypothetical protein